MELGPEEILLLVSRDPAKTAARLEEVKARKAAEARAKLAKDAARLLRSANARFRKAERAEPEDAERLRLEGEERLQDLAQIDPEAWPWARWAGAVRTTEVLVPPDGQAPVYEGLRVAVPNPVTGERQLAEFAQGRTLIIVTHRTSLLALATRVVVVDGGRIVADGPKDRVIEALRQGRIGRAS